MQKIFYTVFAFISTQLVFAQLTPINQVPLQTVDVQVPQKFRTTMPSNYKVQLPNGWQARIFYAGGLAKPRFLAFDGKGVLHVADYNNGKVYALPDKDNDGIADTVITAADNFTLSHDVKFYNGNMYVTEERKVWKLSDADGNGVYEQRVIFIDGIAEGAAQPGGGHRTRTITFDSLNQKVYLSIGSLCNVCREDFRAVIEEYNIDGTGKRIFATGVRNAVGMTMHPVTHRLWANNNGSDRQGSQIPPEWFDIVRDGGFYGYPFAYGNKTYFNFNAHPDYQAMLPITAVDSAKVDRMVFPAAQLEAHSAPMALTFLNNKFPQPMLNGMITALRGSWDSPQDYRGYKLSYIHFSSAIDTTADYTNDFCSGFLTDTVNRVFWARPVGLAINERGSVFMSSDEGNRFIMEIYQTNPPSGLNELKREYNFTLFPNPANNLMMVKSETPLHSITIFDAQGKLVGEYNTEHSTEWSIDTSIYAAGLYSCKFTHSTGNGFVKFQIYK